MYKKLLFTLLVFAGLPIIVNAQLSEKIDIQINTGTAFPLTSSHFETYWNPGIHFGGGLEYALSDMFILKWDAAFNTFIFMQEDWKQDLINEVQSSGEEVGDVIVNGGNRYILESALGINFFPVSNENINPYLTFGVGVINMSTDDLILGLSGPEFTVETVPYYSAGIGLNYSDWEGFSLFGQLIYKYAQTKDENSFKFALDFSDDYRTQETSLIAVEFGIVFDLAQK